MLLWIAAALFGYLGQDYGEFFQWMMWGGVIGAVCKVAGFVLGLIKDALTDISNALGRIAARKAARKAKRAERQMKAVVTPVPAVPVFRAVTPSYHVPTYPLKGWAVCKDMLEQAHLLVGGTTGAGKSTLAHSIIWTMAASAPSDASFFGIDLKRVELMRWERLPHCKGIAKTPEAAIGIIEEVNRIVDTRVSFLERNGRSQYNGGHVYLIVDELAELLSTNRAAVVAGLSRIMRLGRAANVHVLGFTQAPNRAKGGGLDAQLCQNFTAAVALRCRSNIESRQIVGVGGAENLPKHGFGLYWNSDGVNEIEIPMTEDRAIQQRIADWIA